MNRRRLATAALLLLPLLVGGIVFYSAPGATITRLELLRMNFALGQPALVETQRGPVRVWTAGPEGAPVIVLIHGFSDEAPRWAPVAANLKQDFRVVVPELAGHGPSGPTDAPLDSDEIYAALKLALEQKAGPQPALLVGNSLGGWLALNYARDHGERVRRVVAVNSAGLLQQIPTEKLLPTTREGELEKMRAVFGKHAPPMPGFVVDAFLAHDADPRLHSFLKTLEQDDLLDGTLANLKPPVELLWGTPDPWFPESSYLPRLKAELPAPTVAFFEGCGHSPQLGCAAQVVEAIRAAAARPDAPGPAIGQGP